MRARTGVPYEGFPPCDTNLKLLASVWNRRDSGTIDSDWGTFAVIAGEARSWQDQLVLEKALYLSGELAFHPVDALGRRVKGDLGLVLWDAGNRAADLRNLKPDSVLTFHHIVRRDVPFGATTRAWMPTRPTELELKPLLRRPVDERSAILRDLAALLAMGLAEIWVAPPEPEVVVLPAEQQLIVDVRRAIDEGRIGEALERLVRAPSTGQSRAWMGWAIYNDASRPEQNRHASGRMLLRASAREGCPDGLALLGRTLQLEADFAGARHHAERALELAPDNAVARALLESLPPT